MSKRVYAEVQFNTEYALEYLPEFWEYMNFGEQENYKRLFDNQWNYFVRCIRNCEVMAMTHEQMDWCIRMISLQDSFLSTIEKKYNIF